MKLNLYENMKENSKWSLAETANKTIVIIEQSKNTKKLPIKSIRIW